MLLEKRHYALLESVDKDPSTPHPSTRESKELRDAGYMTAKAHGLSLLMLAITKEGSEAMITGGEFEYKMHTGL